MRPERSCAVALTCAVTIAAAMASAITIAPAGASAATPSRGRAGGSRTLTVTGSGDILIHPSLASQAAATGGGSPNFAPMMRDLRP